MYAQPAGFKLDPKYQNMPTKLALNTARLNFNFADFLVSLNHLFVDFNMNGYITFRLPVALVIQLVEIVSNHRHRLISF